MRRRLLASVGGKPLPYDERLLCLTSNGPQQVSTGLLETDDLDTEIILDIEFVGNRNSYTGVSVSQAQWVGTANGVITLGGGIETKLPSQGRYSISISFRAYNISGGKASFEALCKINGVEYRRTGSDYYYSSEYHIFNAAYRTIAYYCSAKVYHVELRSKGGAFGNLIPVLKDSVPCFYDTVRNMFLYNNITGHQLGYVRYNGEEVPPY